MIFTDLGECGLLLWGSQFVPISRLSSICAFLEVPEANNWPFVIKGRKRNRFKVCSFKAFTKSLSSLNLYAVLSFAFVHPF